MSHAAPCSVVVGRLAPSPTGAQHVGNARSFLLAWLSIRSRGGRVILRMEDIDSPRVKPWAAEQALCDLRWLGIDWDEGPDVGGPWGPYVQTARRGLYDAALAQLIADERVYPCTCSRTDVLAAASAPHVGQEGPRYPGTCAKRLAADATSLVAGSYCWRFRIASGLATFTDQIAGIQHADLQGDVGDFVIAKADGSPAYQLAVVVDDHAMGVTDVLRGDDLIPSTFRQLQIYAHFHWQPPTFAHAPLVIGEDGRRLAKRHGDTRLSVLRAAGVRPEQLVGLLAWSCGLRDTDQPASANELLADFSLTKVPREPFVFTPAMWDKLIHSD